MPVKKTTKKSVSKQDRKEIREAARSIPGLIIEHVSFDQNTSMNDDEGTNYNKKYMQSAEKRREHLKKRNTMLFGVGIVVLVLCGMWILNMKSFFFDSKHSISSEQALLSSIRNDYNNTVGLLSAQTTETSSTEPVATEKPVDLRAALIAGLEAASTSSSTLGTATSSTTTSTAESTNFPTAKTVTSTTNTTSTP